MRQNRRNPRKANLVRGNNEERPDVPEPKSIEERFGERVQVQDDGCWIYTAGPSAYGSYMGKPAHYFAYELMVGPIPKGKHIHHLCHTPRCVRPSHLQPLTPSEHAQLHAKERRHTRVSQMLDEINRRNGYAS